MAKKAYVGTSNVARNISKMYVGVGGVARKITKAYVGVNGVAQQFFSSTTLTPFTTSPIARSWSGTETAANVVFTATNTYGEWKCHADQESTASNGVFWHTFDGDASTSAIAKVYTNDVTVVLEFPTGITIQPSEFTMVLGSYFAKDSVVQGRRVGTTTWDTFYTQASGTGSTTTTNVTQAVATTYFYDQIRAVYHGASSYRPRVKEIDITSGILKDER